MEIEEAGFQFGLLDAQGPHVHKASGFLVEIWVSAEVLLQLRLTEVCQAEGVELLIQAATDWHRTPRDKVGQRSVHKANVFSSISLISDEESALRDAKVFRGLGGLALGPGCR